MQKYNKNGILPKSLVKKDVADRERGACKLGDSRVLAGSLVAYFHFLAGGERLFTARCVPKFISITSYLLTCLHGDLGIGIALEGGQRYVNLGNVQKEIAQ